MSEKRTPIPKKYKVVEVIKENIDGEEPYITKWKEKRWIIVNSETGEIIDDAQGYGYKSIQNAYKAIHYKLNKNKIDKEKETIFKFIRNHKSFFKRLMINISDKMLHGEEVENKEIIDYILEQDFEDCPTDHKNILKYMWEFN